MKLFKLALCAVALLTFALLATAAAHHTPYATGIALAMEPASWVFVAFGLAGGGFLHKRRLSSLNLVAAPQNDTPGKP